MIDRSYLPFQSAREYQDVKMQKWMGFFLSEHHSALSEDATALQINSMLSLNQKLLLLGQSYSNQLAIEISIKESNTLKNLTGIISTITKSHILLKTLEGYHNISLDNIISIKQSEENYVESA